MKISTYRHIVFEFLANDPCSLFVEAAPTAAAEPLQAVFLRLAAEKSPSIFFI